MLKPRKKKSL